MIAPDSGKVTIEDRIYRDGYRDGEDDTFKRILAQLWNHRQSLEKAFPEFAQGIEIAIDEIEKLKHY
jgi:hypothetical protein